MRQAFTGALAGHFQQPQRGKAVHGDARVVARQGFLEFLQHGIAVFLGVHVDIIADDDAAQVAQTQLPRDHLCGLQIGLEDGVVEIAQADETSGVHIHRGHGFGLVDDEIAAGL